MRTAKCSFFSADKWPPKPFASISLHLVSLPSGLRILIQAPPVPSPWSFPLSSSLLLLLSSPSLKVDVKLGFLD